MAKVNKKPTLTYSLELGVLQSGGELPASMGTRTNPHEVGANRPWQLRHLDEVCGIDLEEYLGRGGE